MLYAAIAAAAPAGPHCSRGAEGREGGEVDACLCLCGWLCTVVNRCEHNDCQTRQLHKQYQCCPRSSKNKAATCMRAMVHLDVCSFLVLFLPSVLMQQPQQQHLAPVLSLELLGTGATAASGSSHPPPPWRRCVPRSPLMTGEACCVRMISSCFLFPATISPNTHPPSHSERAGSGSGRHRQQEEGRGDDKDVHDVATTWRVLMKPMLVVRRLSAGVRGRCGCGQGQQKGARRLSSTTESSSTNGAVYWGRQWEKAKEAAPVVVSVLGFGAVIAEGTRRQVQWARRRRC